MEILNTGERILLEKETPQMIARHFCAYKFAREHVLNNAVLDIGCGEGYGSSFLAETAKEVTAIDYNKEIIDYAKDKYQKGNLKFYALDTKDLLSLGRVFDIICCFQVIEHIPDADKFLESVCGLMGGESVFICSTPNKLDASPRTVTPANKFHLKEYLLNEFENLLQKHFRQVKIHGLKRGRKLDFYRRLKKIGLFNFLPGSIDPVKRFYRNINCDNFVFINKDLDAALDFIAVCRR